jgi:hypothetical protein
MKNISSNQLLALTTAQLIELMREISAGLAGSEMSVAERHEAQAILAEIRAILAQRRAAKMLSVLTP